MITLLLTILALLAFAGNSILCRLALGDDAIDAGSFTWIRLLSGVVVLLLIVKTLHSDASVTSKGSWKASFMLFLYAITFSFAYISLDTGTGALILFASVQMTMIATEVVSGKKLLVTEWLGAVIAFLGFIYLLVPGLSTPSVSGFILMSISGIAWGYYTLAGKRSVNPLVDTTYNFVRTLPFIVVLVLASVSVFTTKLSMEGILLAVLSGGLTSGVGYAIWYVALGGLSGTQAAILQLTVPVIAAFGGVLFANEEITSRLMVASVIILGGILLLILGKQGLTRKPSTKV